MTDAHHIKEGEVVLLNAEVGYLLPLLACGVNACGVVRTACGSDQCVTVCRQRYTGNMILASIHRPGEYNSTPRRFIVTVGFPSSSGQPSKHGGVASYKATLGPSEAGQQPTNGRSDPPHAQRE